MAVHVSPQPDRIFAIGDIQGCYDEFCRLLDKIDFDAERDHLLLTGDLVNRGPDSLSVLHKVKSLGTSVSSVLGNHDLHLLAVWCGAKQQSKRDTLDDVINDVDAPATIDWLRRLPLLAECQHDGQHIVLTHAGIYPFWSLAQARANAESVQACLASDGWQALCHQMYGDKPDVWSEALSDWPRLRFITNAFTRMRFFDGNRMDLKAKGGPADHPELTPWYDVKHGADPPYLRVFGHWSTLGFLHNSDTIALDTGCLWGRSLTAVRLLPGSIERYEVSCRGYAKIKRG